MIKIQLHSMEPSLLTFPHINPATHTYTACQGAFSVDTMECSIHMMCSPPRDITLYMLNCFEWTSNICCIFSHWDGAGSWNPSLCSSYIFNTMAADDLVTQWATASAVMVLTHFSWHIPASAPERLTQSRLHILACPGPPYDWHPGMLHTNDHRPPRQGFNDLGNIDRLENASLQDTAL